MTADERIKLYCLRMVNDRVSEDCDPVKIINTARLYLKFITTDQNQYFDDPPYFSGCHLSIYSR